MFFYLSKIFWLFIQPLNLAILLLMVGLIAALVGRRKLFVRSCALAFLVLALSAWTSLGALMLNPLEERFPRPPLPQKVDGIVVLGGGFEGAININYSMWMRTMAAVGIMHLLFARRPTEAVPSQESHGDARQPASLGAHTPALALPAPLRQTSTARFPNLMS